MSHPKVCATLSKCPPKICLHLSGCAYHLAGMDTVLTRSALYPCLPNGKHARSSAPAQRCISSAPAQHCIHACQMVSTPVQVHLLSTVSMPAKWKAHPFKCTRSALYPCLPNGKHTRSSAPAHPCLPNGKHTRSSAHAQLSIHACQMVSTPAQGRRVYIYRDFYRVYIYVNTHIFIHIALLLMIALPLMLCG